VRVDALRQLDAVGDVADEQEGEEAEAGCG
jgi:hypothetical protein